MARDDGAGIVHMMRLYMRIGTPSSADSGRGMIYRLQRTTVHIERLLQIRQIGVLTLADAPRRLLLLLVVELLDLALSCLYVLQPFGAAWAW